MRAWDNSFLKLGKFFGQSRTAPLFLLPSILKTALVWIALALALSLVEWLFSSRLQTTLFSMREVSSTQFASFAVIVLSVLVVLRLGLSFASQYLFHKVHAKVGQELRSSWSSLALSQNSNRPDSSKLHSIMSDSIPCASLAVSTLLLCYFHVVLVLCLSALCLWIEWELFALAIGGFLLLLLPASRLAHWSTHMGAQRNQSMIKFYSSMNMIKRNEMMFYFSNQEDRELARLEGYNDTAYTKQLQADFFMVFMKVAPQAVGYFLILALCLYTFSIDPSLSSQLLVICYLVLRFFQSVSQGWGCYGSYRSLKPALLEACEVYQYPLEKKCKQSRVQTAETELKQIDLQDFVVYHPKTKEKMVGPINLSLKIADQVLIQGSSGSGKSTFLEALAGLYPHTEGQLLINGKVQNLHESGIKIAYLNSQPFVFGSTVLESLNWTLEEDLKPSNLKLQKYLQELGLKSTPEFLNSPIENLSHGESQRLALVRALLKEPQLLILDEAANGLDEINHQKVLKLIQEEASQRIVLYVSHKPLTRNRFHYLLDFNQLDSSNVIQVGAA